MKISCEIIEDLLPLYVENIASPDSCSLVEEHIGSCEACRNKLAELRVPSNIPTQLNTAPLKKIKSKLRLSKQLTILFSVMLTLVVVVLAIFYLTAPRYLPYGEGTEAILKNGGYLIVDFSSMATGCEVSKRLADDNSGYVYTISPWDSIWNRNIIKSNTRNIILNPAREAVTSVYYSSNDGNEDMLLYGEDQASGGGIVTLPRLVLTYYGLLALAFAMVCGLVVFLFRRHKKVAGIGMKIMFLPLAYLAGQLCITGFDASSYSATRDFCAILLVMLPLYCAMLVARSLVANIKASRAK